mgnify:CR=1 FL=1
MTDNKLLAELLLDHINSRRNLMQDYAWGFARERGYKPELMWVVKPGIRPENKVKYKVCVYLGPKGLSSSFFRFVYINVFNDGTLGIYDSDTTLYSNGRSYIYRIDFFHASDQDNLNLLWQAA